MDNLDRTNVAQSAIAKWMLDRQLKELRVIQENDSVDNYDELTRDFRESASLSFVFGVLLINLSPPYHFVVALPRSA